MIGHKYTSTVGHTGIYACGDYVRRNLGATVVEARIPPPSGVGSVNKFQGSGNHLNLEGTNNFNSTKSSGTMHKAVINVGGGLTVESKEGNAAQLNFSSTNKQLNYYGACIGLDAQENLSSGVTINGGTFTSSLFRGGGAVIGGGNGGSIGNIEINGGTFIERCTYNNAAQDALIGGSGSTGNITIQNAVIDMQTVSQTNEPAIGASGRGTAGNISVSNSQIIYRGTGGAAIGTSGTWTPAPGKAGDITIENCLLDVQTSTGAGIGSGNRGTVGNITVIHTDLSNVRSTSGEQVGKGAGGTCGTVDLTQASGYTPIVWQNVHSGVSEPINTTETPETVISQGIESVTRTLRPPNPLWIQHGTQANQRIHVYINSMQTKDLKGTIPNEADAAQLAALSNSPEKQAELQEILDKAKEMTLDDARVTTVDNAKVVIRVVEGALEYALNEATTMGAYLQRMEYTGTNITTTSENTQAAESTIRDADMAKEMTEYTKYNLLTQSAQAMLAQANQNHGAILNLLQ